MRLNKSVFKKTKAGFYNKETVKEETILYIYDEISPWGIDAKSIVKDIASATGPIRMKLNTPGGNVFDGIAIYSAMRASKNEISVDIEGIAASAGAIIAMGGTKINMAENAFLMIHEAWTLMVGNASDLRKEADVLEKIDEQIVNIFSKKSGKDNKEVKKALSAETWFNGQEAMDWGLIDNIIETEPAQNLFDLSVFNNVPDALRSPSCETLDERTLETILRDAGLSRKEAKAFMAEGVKVLNLRDADEESTAIQSIINQIRS